MLQLKNCIYQQYVIIKNNYRRERRKSLESLAARGLITHIDSLQVLVLTLRPDTIEKVTFILLTLADMSLYEFTPSLKEKESLFFISTSHFQNKKNS